MATSIRLSLLRGVCQMPAYVACDQGYLEQEGIRAEIEIAATAWLVPQKLASGACQFAVMPWTRVAAAEAEGLGLVLVAGSGFEEAAIVLRHGIAPDAVRKVSVPMRGGIKDLTAMGLIASLGWEAAAQVRQPSGDGAIIALFGQGADAASMVEPYATMMEGLGVGRVIRRTGDLWPGAPGCSLTTTRALIDADPGLVEAVVRAFARGVDFVREHPDAAADLAAPYIGIATRFIRAALDHNHPDIDAIRNERAMCDILALMMKLGYIQEIPTEYRDLRFLDKVAANAGS